MKERNNDIRAIKSGIWYTISSFAVRTIGLVTAPLFTRLLSKSDYGQYGNYTSCLSIFVILTTLNLESTLISARYDYKDNVDDYVFSSIALSSFSAFIWMLVINCFNSFFTKTLGISQMHLNFMMIYLLFLPIVKIFQARERYRFEYKKTILISSIISIATPLVSLALVISLEDKLTGRIVGSIIPTVLVGIVLIFVLFKEKRKFSIEHWKYALPIALPYIPHLLSMHLLGSMDQIMITNMLGSEANAMYSVAYLSATLISILITAMNGAFAPWIGEKLFSKEYNSIRSVTRKYIGLFVIISIGIFLINPELLAVLGGKNYSDSLAIMPIVTASCVIQFLYTLFVNVEQYKKKTSSMALASFSAAAINGILNYLLIPKYGYIAAAYTTLIGYLWLLFIHIIVVHRIGYIKIFDMKIVSLAVMFALVSIVISNVLYSNNLVRWILIIIYAVAIAMILVKYRHDLFDIFKSKGD